MAQYFFPAIFTAETNGHYQINFPDLGNCYTQGDNLREAYEMAKDVLCLTLYDREETNQPIPQPSSPQEITINKDSFIVIIEADTLDYRMFYDHKAVKKTLTIPSWLNKMAIREGVNFSYILQNALKEKLNISKRS